jgi:hypothetical protein
VTASALNWTPEPHLLEQLISLAQQKGQPLETLITEAIVAYLKTQSSPLLEGAIEEPDPLIGLFAGSPNLATQSEEALQELGIP